MNKTNNSKKRFFTAADVLIGLIVLALIIGSIVLFLLPSREESTAVTVNATMLIHLPETPVGIAEGDRLFYNNAEIGVVKSIYKADNDIKVYVALEKDDGVYLLNGNPIRKNGNFVIETKLRRIEGVISDLVERGTE